MGFGETLASADRRCPCAGSVRLPLSSFATDLLTRKSSKAISPTRGERAQSASPARSAAVHRRKATIAGNLAGDSAAFIPNAGVLRVSDKTEGGTNPESRQ